MTDLGTDANTTGVQRLDGDLVALAELADNAALGDADRVEMDRTSAAGSDAQLVLGLADGHAGLVAVDEETGDAAVALLGLCIGHDEEEVRVTRRRYPHLIAVDDKIVAVGACRRLQRKRVGPTRRLRKTERTDLQTISLCVQTHFQHAILGEGSEHGS